MQSRLRCVFALGILCVTGCRDNRGSEDNKVSLRLHVLPIGESGNYRLTADAKGQLMRKVLLPALSSGSTLMTGHASLRFRKNQNLCFPPRLVLQTRRSR